MSADDDESKTVGQQNVVRLNDIKNMTEIEALEAAIVGIQDDIRMIDEALGGDPQKRQRDRCAALKRLAAAQRSLQATHDRIARKNLSEVKARIKYKEKQAKEHKKAAEELKKTAAQEAKEAKEAEKAEAQAEAEANAETSDEIRARHRDSVAYILEEHDLYLVLKAGTYMECLEGEWYPIQPKTLKVFYPILNKAIYAFDEVLIEAGRKYKKATFSFHEVSPDTLNMMRPNFVELVDDGEPVHWFFRVLMESLGGGRQENADHVEALLARKYCEPWDYMLPALVIENRRGGCGKGILGGKLAPTIFGKTGVADNISMRDFIGQFNSHVMGKVLLVINETIEDKYDDNRLKQMLHSPTIMGEQKFMPRMSFDNTALCVICGNGATGSVKLAGNDIDRRVSVIRATKTLDEWVGIHEGISPAEAKLMIRDTLQHVLTDPVEVGRWMNHIIKKWEHLPMIAGLHGADYDHFVAVQEPFYNELYTAVFTEPGFSHIRVDTLFDMFIHFNKEKNHSFSRVRRKTFAEHAEYWIEKNLPDQIAQWKVHTPNSNGRSTMDVWSLTSNPKTLPDNDFKYFVKIDGRTEWKFRM